MRVSGARRYRPQDDPDLGEDDLQDPTTRDV